MTGGRGRRIVLCDLLIIDSSALPKPAGTWGEALRPMASGAAAAYPRLPRPPGGTCTRPQMRVSAVAARASTGASIRTGGRGGSGSGGGSAARAGGCLTAHAGCGSESSGSPLRSSNEMPGDGIGGAGGRRTSCCRRCRSAALPRSACWRISSTRRCWSCHLSVARARPGA